MCMLNHPNVFGRDILYHSAQFGFPDMLAGNVLGRVGPAIIVCFGVRPPHKLLDGVVVLLAENS